MSDPDMGSWTYGYDAIGTLASQTDAKPHRLIVYDVLKRPLRTYYPASWTTPTPTQPSVCDLIELRCAIYAKTIAAPELSPRMYGKIDIGR